MAKSLVNYIHIRMTELKGFASCVLQFLFLLCLFMFFIGCYETEVANIMVKVDSKVDMNKYHTIAVIDFIDKKTKPSETNGKIIARMIRKQLKSNKDFQVLDERNMELDGELHEDDIKDPATLVSISNQLGVDSLIVGEFEFYQRYQSVPYIVERYSTNTGKYTPEARNYVQNVYGLSINARVIDGATGETVFSYAPRAEEKPDYQSSLALPFSDGTSDPANLRAIAMKPVTNLVLSLIPHYEKERRLLVK
jgi:hypothetical protein